MVIPTVVDKSSALDIYSKMLEKGRVVFLVGQIDDQVAMNVCAQLLYLASTSSKDISLYINSPGGVITAALAIYDTMQLIKPDVVTFCCGQAASAAAMLLASGTKLKRYCLPHGRVMIHQPLIGGGGISGQQTDIAIQAKEMARLRSLIEKIFERHAGHKGKTAEVLREDTERDYMMTPEEAVDYSLVDQIFYGECESNNTE